MMSDKSSVTWTLKKIKRDILQAKIKVEIVGVYHRNVKNTMCVDSTYFPKILWY